MYQGESSQHAVNRDLAFCYGGILNYRSQYDAIGFGGNPTFELRFSFWGSGGSIHRQLLAKSENSFKEQVNNIRKNSKEGIPYGSAAILSLNYDDLPGQIKYAISIPVSSDTVSIQVSGESLKIKTDDVIKSSEKETNRNIDRLVSFHCQS
jgi:hypothetical protein